MKRVEKLTEVLGQMAGGKERQMSDMLGCLFPSLTWWDIKKDCAMLLKQETANQLKN